MRKVTAQSIESFTNNVSFKSQNMKIEVRNNETFMYLHNNMIAHKYDNNSKLFISTCGWESNTTKERLNGLLYHYNLPRISQKSFVWYLGDNEFKGTKIFDL
jgi:hypothetical protein